MAREGDVTRVFLARAPLHYDAAHAALPFCPVATQFRSRGTLCREHTRSSRAPVNVSARTGALDGGQRGVPITPIPRESIFHATRGVTPITRATGMDGRFRANKIAPRFSSRFPGKFRNYIRRNINKII